MERPDIEHASGRAGQRRDLAHRGQQQLAAFPVGRGDHDAVPGGGIDAAPADRRGRNRTAVEQRIGEERPEGLPPQVVFDDIAKLVEIDQAVLLAVDALDVHRAEQLRGTFGHQRLLGLQSAVADHAADARGPDRAVLVLIKGGYVGLVETLTDAQVFKYHLSRRRGGSRRGGGNSSSETAKRGSIYAYSVSLSIRQDTKFREIFDIGNEKKPPGITGRRIAAGTDVQSACPGTDFIGTASPTRHTSAA